MANNHACRIINSASMIRNSGPKIGTEPPKIRSAPRIIGTTLLGLGTALPGLMLGLGLDSVLVRSFLLLTYIASFSQVLFCFFMI